jgi:hypothetical protein
MHPVIAMLPFPFGILNVVCKVSLISLIDFTDVKEYASDLQAILGIKIIAEEVKKEEEYLMALLSDDGYRQQFNLRYTINAKIKDKSCCSNLPIFDLILSSVSSNSCRIFCSSVSKCEFILARICLIWS